jgi:small subunit ribosomal protein S7
MSRRRKASTREVLPDPKYDNTLLSLFISGLMRKGKRSLAERIMYQSLEIIEQKMGQPGLPVFQKAVNNIKPVIEVKSRRVGGATYQVPVEVRANRRTALAIRWVIRYAKQRPEHTMAERLAAELMSASKNEGASAKKKEDTHKMAEANKAFAHYRW